MTMFTPEFIQKQRVIANRATPRPWKREYDAVCCEDCEGISTIMIYGPQGEGYGRTGMAYAECGDDSELDGNADYIEISANYYPDALDEIERLRSLLEEIRDELSDINPDLFRRIDEALHPNNDSENLSEVKGV